MASSRVRGFGDRDGECFVLHTGHWRPDDRQLDTQQGVEVMAVRAVN
jgi:hypothetical protein